MTREEMHIKALSKGIDSQTIKGSMTVMLLGHAVDMMMELQDAHEAEIQHLTGVTKAQHDTIQEQARLIESYKAEIKAKNEEIELLKRKSKAEVLTDFLKTEYGENMIKMSEQLVCKDKELKAKDECIESVVYMLRRVIEQITGYKSISIESIFNQKVHYYDTDGGRHYTTPLYKIINEIQYKDERIAELEAKNQELEDLLISHYPNYMPKDTK